MAGVAYYGASIASTAASNHIRIKYWHPRRCSGGWIDGVCQGWTEGYYQYDSIDATINGAVNGGSSNVFVNGMGVARQGDSTAETETYSIPSGWDLEHSDGGGAGSITIGNSKSVFVNGSPIAVTGSTVSTHAGVSTTIKDGSSNVFIG
ncbi:hypothetical protein M3650_24625 [Paenibacillus sp. MER TA 81-3]|uniref:hypothetical protein n=1 Tax=Paenibacillus sp. MER TA 81-3 TaxID=2939573 RepID=UPI0020419D8C|nr:hypothetical protein [Paenibacillus sp. MER TA 81-3]MCM3341722.1 hypothetical protein [Paenibacillus sp. MER TA 81-3]